MQIYRRILSDHRTCSSYNMRLNSSDLGRVQGRPLFVLSQGCYPNDPDTDNFTIKAVRMAQYGPAAMISNTRYGWYVPGQGGEGSSAILHRTFWSTHFANGVRSIGPMNHKAKQIFIGTDHSSLAVYTALESNLIGDPELDLGN